MLATNIKITSEDIQYAEKILLSGDGSFDKERKDFIKDLSTLDLHAVPGSGKTTTLLAKLLILERKLPFEDGSGILVISHTNTAIDEIKDKIGAYCPKLFSYPNFIGTIQSFVNNFLAKPFGQNVLDTRFSHIDVVKYKKEIYLEFRKIYWEKNYDKPGKLFYGRNYEKAKRQASSTGISVEKTINSLIQSEVENLFFDFKDNKIKTFKNNSTILADSKNKKYKGIKEVIMKVLKSGIISYDYAYRLANSYIDFFPRVKNLLQLRFSYVFVDEMQDMDYYQYTILERIFFDAGKSNTIYQRIGDRNQAIYNSDTKLDVSWEPREKELELSGSHRLSKNIADVVQYFGLSSQKINGLNKNDDGSEIELLPHLIVYDDETCKCKVIQKFVEITKRYQEEGRIPLKLENPIKAIAWRKQNYDLSKISITDYCVEFGNSNFKPKLEHNCLESHLIYYNKEVKQLKEIRNNILNAFIKILRLEEVKDKTDKYYLKRKLIKYLKDQNSEAYKTLKLNLYKWCISIIRGQKEEVLSGVQEYLDDFLIIFDKKINRSYDFIYAKANQNQVEKIDLNNESECECCKINGSKIKIATVHSAKGETHTATLYMETYFHKDGKGKKSKSYESQRLSNQFNKKAIKSTDGIRVKKSSKMVYVGFSRPTHLLAFAVHSRRYNKYLNGINLNKWKVIKL